MDETDDGRHLVIDYKTGSVARKDWTEDRMAKPQMPLYSVMLEKAESAAIAGISYAKVDSKEHKFVELSEVGILRADNKTSQGYQDQWQEGKARWPEMFEELAEQFLAGHAQVNPIEENTCLYCDLKSLCRVSQLRDSGELQMQQTEGDHD